MISTIIMPQGGQDLTTGRIIRWLKNEGDAVKKDEVVCEVETEKAVLEVNATQDGVLLKILANEQEEVQILAPIGYIGEKGDQVPDSEKSQDKEAKPIEEKSTPSSQTSSARSASQLNEKVKISPTARKIAKDHNLQLETLAPYFHDGKITAEDMQQIIRQYEEDSGREGEPNVDIQWLNPIQKASARRLSATWNSVPHIFVTVSVDMTEAVSFRKKHSDSDVTFNDLVVFASVLAIRKFPTINSSYAEDGKLRVWKDINIGMAVNTAEGLIVPVVEDADRLSLQELSLQTKLIVKKIREGKQAATKPSRFTISNLGMYNVDQFTAIINPPEAAILAVSTIRKTPVVVEDDKIAVREMMNLTLSLDHRIGSGVLAAEFLNEIKRVLEDPESIE